MSAKSKVSARTSLVIKKGDKVVKTTPIKKKIIKKEKELSSEDETSSDENSKEELSDGNSEEESNDENLEEESSDENSEEESSSEKESSGANSKKDLNNKNSKKESSDRNSDDESYSVLNLMKEKKDHFITCKESIDVDKLYNIIKNKDNYEDLLSKHDFDNGNKSYSKEPFKLAKEYLERSRQGNVPVIYKQKRGQGRYYALKSLSLQCLKKEIRHAIAINYIDIDMCNAGPTILNHLCKQLKINCKILESYCNDREKFYNKEGLTKEKCKDFFY